MIWNNDKQHEALALLKLKDFEDGIVDVLGVFDFMVFKPELPKSGRLRSVKHTKDPKIAAEFVNILMEVRTTISEETKVYIDTAIIEALSFLNDNSRLCDFFESNPTVSADSLQEFFKGVKGVLRSSL